MTIRVLVIDDSALMRALLSEFINRSPGMEVVGCAPDAQTAREMIKTLAPDVLTLDVQMPGMDGLEFLERLMRLRPMPVVMVSALTQAGSETTLRALELGAVEVIGKPRADTPGGTGEYIRELQEKIRVAYGARLRGGGRPPASAVAASAPVAPQGLSNPPRPVGSGERILFVGASTGGTEAIRIFLAGMPASCPPILVVQHMPENFTASFAKRLDGLCAPRVLEAQGGERVESGTVYIAPGWAHLRIVRTGAGYRTETLATAPVNRHRPSVDVLFDSAVEAVGRPALGVILTGMGKDGAHGLLRMREAGARTFGQDENSCVVYGMPREAARIGALEEVVPIEEMAGRVLQSLGRS